MMWLAALATSAWLGLQIFSWWPPYLFGATDQWAQVYARAFAQATPILPRWGNHLPPDAMHLVLQLLLVGSVAAATIDLLHHRRRLRSNTAFHPPAAEDGPSDRG